MRILVTGAAGFIGSHLAERLAADGHTVVGLDNFAPFYAPALKRANAKRLADHGIRVWPLDLATDPLTPALDGVEAVFHLAAQPGLSAATSEADFVRNNVRATERLLDALAHQPQVRALLYASSSSVYGLDATHTESDGDLAPTSAYGRTKLQAERAICSARRNAPWDACILRLFSVYGPRERPDKLIHKAIRCAQSGHPFPLHAGSEQHTRSFTYVGDAVAGLVAALDRFDRCAGETINVGSPVSVSTLQALETVASVLDTPLRLHRTPTRPGDQTHTRARIAKARRLLDVAPATSLRDGIAAEVDWIATLAPSHTERPVAHASDTS